MVSNSWRNSSIENSGNGGASRMPLNSITEPQAAQIPFIRNVFFILRFLPPKNECHRISPDSFAWLLSARTAPFHIAEAS